MTGGQTVIIRFLTQADIVAHDKVTSQAFSIACDIYDKTSVLPSEKVLGAFDDDNKTLFADLELIERKCNYDGGILSCAAIGGVAAKPEHRGKGAVKALFEHLFAMNEYDISILYPFSDAYYRKLGYDSVGNAVSASVPFSELSGISRNNDVWMYEGTDGRESLLAIYNKCARTYPLSFVRENTQAFSDEPYLSGRYTYIWKNNAFATISVDRETSVLNVSELYFDSCESMRGILGFLRNFESNQKTICFHKLPVNSPVFHYISNLNRCDIRMQSTGAARILNLENVLKLRQYPSQTGAFTIQVGADVFHVTLSANGAAVERNGAHSPDAVMDIGIASKLLLSGFENAAYIPGLTINDPQSDFFRLFPPKPAFFTDGF